MEYQVPQFIEVEDKIFGPLSLKQFIFLAGGIGLTVILVLYLPLFIGIVLAIPVMGLASALAFYRVNNKNFTDILGAGISFYTKGRLYLWKKEDKSDAPLPVEMQKQAPVAREKLGISSNRLHDLALSLDIQDRDNPQS